MAPECGKHSHLRCELVQCKWLADNTTRTESIDAIDFLMIREGM